MSKVVKSVSSALNEKLVQISLTGAVLFYIVASPVLFDFVSNLMKKVLGVFGVDFKLEGQQLVLFHAVIFGSLLYLSSKYLLKHVVDLVKNK